MTRTGPITKNFTWEEARCRCGCEMPEAVALEVVLTADMMERIRAHLGGLPLHIAAWYRCAAHNKAIGGAPNSQHLSGRGVDFSQKGHSPTEIQARIRRELWPDPVRGLELEPGHTHVDRRPSTPVVFDAHSNVIERA